MTSESDQLLKQAREFLISYLYGKENGFETIHPWRKGWKFVILHSFRVEAYAIRILKQEDHPLSEDEIQLVRLAAILHDIGRTQTREAHAPLSAAIVRDWFLCNPRITNGAIDLERLLNLIASHSLKGQPEPDFASAVLMDADTLDEIGVFSIIMTANRVDRNSPFFFNQLLQRLQNYEIPFCDRKLAVLHTAAARQILETKRNFITVFIAQLTDELTGTETASNEINQFVTSGLNQENDSL